ncbi:oxygenase MpaB family protein [Pseudomonas oryzihabitans]|uniref:oxygenase MpaB family protein n=1 Tax=Pseudomonas oryzihabitans TaxID=47885 RepID=UPI0011AAF0D5|nr:oxygenase MpaB family protein [Pseudomonas oryzihabitans]
MERIRSRIEQQVMSLTGLALGEVDYEQPPGDPGLFGPGSVPWRVHSDFTCMLIGGIAALLMQTLHPLALAGVWDHSKFREDMLGRLRRTGQFIAATTFGSRGDAERLIARVKAIHRHIRGQAADGRPYSAEDPALLTWVHVAEVSHFLAAYLRYFDPRLPGTEQDRYYAEIALVAERLGATDVPRSRAEIAAYYQAIRPQLVCDERSREVCRVLLQAPAPSALAKPFGALMMQAGIDLLPDWASAELGFHQSALQRQLIRTGISATAPVLRWAVRNGSSHRARRRMGIEG